MVVRPSDWFLVGLPVDPTPGDAFGIRALAGKYGEIAQIAGEASTGVRHARSSGAASAWVGDAGDVFRDKSDRMPGELAKANDSYDMVAEALRAWAAAVDDTQAQADRGLQQAREAHHDLGAAQAALASAEWSWTTAHAQQLTYQTLTKAYSIVPPPPGVKMPTEYQLRGVDRAAQQAQASITSAKHAIADADARLAAARALVVEAKARRDVAEKATVRSINEAMDAAVKPASMWEAITSSAAWSAIVTIATVVLTIVSIVAIFVGGPLVWALIIAATVLLLADALMKAAQGQDMTMTIVLLLVGLIPGGRALTSVAHIAGVFRSAGSVARGLGAVGIHLLSVSKGAVLDLVRSLKPAALVNTAHELQKGAIGLFPGLTSMVHSIPGAIAHSAAMTHGPISFLHELKSTMGNDFALGSAKGWADHVMGIAADDPAGAAALWQRGGGYHEADQWSNTLIEGGETFEAGVGGPVSNFAFDGGSAASLGHDLNDIAAGGQIGSGGVHPVTGGPSLRDSMFSMQAAPGAEIRAAHSTVESNIQFGAGGLHQTFFPNMTGNIRDGQILVISNATGLPVPSHALTFVDETNSAGQVMKTQVLVDFGPGDVIPLHGDPFATTFPSVKHEAVMFAEQLGERGPALRLGIHLGVGIEHGGEAVDQVQGAR